jgi:HK97 family phage major capsid protein
VRFNQNDARLNFVEGVGAVGADGEISAEMRMDNDTQGGFMVPPQLRATIMQVEPQDALVRPRANVIPAGSPPDAGVTMPALDQTGSNPANMFGGVAVQWIGEGDDKPETDAKLKSITLTPQEVAGTIVVTDKLLRNWQAAGPFLENLLRGATTAAEDYAFLRGTGVHQPLGAINSGAMYFINRALANHVGYVDLVTMVSRFLMRGGQAPVWSMPQSALVDIATMQDPEGHYIWQANAKDGFAGTLLGYPVRWNNRSPSLGTKGDITLIDWSQYLIKDGSGPYVAASEHVLFRQNKTVVKIFWNVDGAPWLTAPIKEENGYQVSPFVGLDVPA